MLKVNELFSGIGSQRAALERLGIEHEIVGIAEIDKDAILSYAAIHCDLSNKLKCYDFPSEKDMVDYLEKRNIGFDFKKGKPFSWKKLIDKITGKAKKDLKKYYLASILSNNYGDISKIEKLDYADFWTYSFPCQDISIAGLQRGINEHTRSGLLYQVERLLQVSKDCGELPKYLMLENVKNLVGKKFKAQFDDWIKRLDELGFNTYWQVLNAKNYGIPQNRERVFAISIRKDVDTGYEFPQPFDNGIRLKDILEKEVNEKYYINRDFKLGTFADRHDENEIGQLTGMNYKCTRTITNPNMICRCLDTMGGGQREPKVLEPCKARSIGRNPENPSDRTVGSPTEQRLEINKNGTSNTLTTVQKDNYVVESNMQKIGNTTPSGKSQCNDVYSIDGIHPTLCAGTHGNCNSSILIEPQFRIRKLTPLECFRLMGFTDVQFRKAEIVNSNSQLYKQAGNSIVVDVLYYLFKNLFIQKDESIINEIPRQMRGIKSKSYYE